MNEDTTISSLTSADPSLSDLPGYVSTLDPGVTPMAPVSEIQSANNIGSIIGPIGADILGGYSLATGKPGIVSGSSFIPASISSQASTLTTVAILAGVAVIGIIAFR